MFFLVDYEEPIYKFLYFIRNNSSLYSIFFYNSFKILNSILIKELSFFLNLFFYSYNLYYLKIVKIIELFKNKYTSSLKSYRTVHDYLIEILYFFKKKNTYMQARYNNKIILQKSVGMFGYKKREKTIKYARNAISNGFVRSFSNIYFVKSYSIHFFLKGLRKSYKRNVRPLIDNLKYRILNKYSKFKNFFKFLDKKIRILKSVKEKGIWSDFHIDKSKMLESNKLIEVTKSKAHSFTHLRCFYLSISNFGGIRLRRRKKSRYRGY